MVNHAYAEGGERIEVFDIRVDSNDVPYRLDYKYSITSDFFNDKLMGVINSIVVVDKNKFYITKFMDAHNVDGTFEMPTTLSCVHGSDVSDVTICFFWPAVRLYCSMNARTSSECMATTGLGGTTATLFFFFRNDAGKHTASKMQVKLCVCHYSVSDWSCMIKNRECGQKLYLNV